MNTIMIGFKNQPLFPRFAFKITVGTLIELCCRGDKFSTNFEVLQNSNYFQLFHQTD